MVAGGGREEGHTIAQILALEETMATTTDDSGFIDGNGYGGFNGSNDMGSFNSRNGYAFMPR